MKTGDVIYTRIANMGNKVRPCVAICGNSLKELFLIPISSKDWNTLSTVSISFKNKKGSVVLNEAFISTISNVELSDWAISIEAFQKIFQRLNERLDDNWREFLSTYGCI
jgi:predicted component of type VI protein secretion system